MSMRQNLIFLTILVCLLLGIAEISWCMSMDKELGINFQYVTNNIFKKGKNYGLSSINYTEWINKNLKWKLSFGYWKIDYDNTYNILQEDVKEEIEESLDIFPLQFSMIGIFFSDKKISPFLEGGLGLFSVKYRHTKTWQIPVFDIIIINNKEKYYNNLLGFHLAAGIRICFSNNFSSNLVIGFLYIPTKTAGTTLTFADEELKDLGGTSIGLEFNYHFRGNE